MLYSLEYVPQKRYTTCLKRETDKGNTKARTKKCVSDIIGEINLYYVKRYYWITEVEFWMSYNVLLPVIHHQNEGKRNIQITPIAIAHRMANIKHFMIQYCYSIFSGSSPFDLMALHGMGLCDVYTRVYLTADAMNLCPQIKVEFLTCHN